MRKQIKDYEGLYDIDAEGNVYSLPKLMPTPTTTFYTKERILKPFSNKKGYLLVTLVKNKIQKNVQIHRLVAQAFIDNPFNKPQVNHLNGIKTDNRVENLEWCTNGENQLHAFENELQKGNFNHPNSKLKLEEVLYIKNNYVKGKKGFGQRTLAKKFNVNVATIKQIIVGKSYRNIK